jgi:hypothetical protein
MKRNKYRTLEDFDKDIMLMAQNVFKFYDCGEDIYWVSA